MNTFQDMIKAGVAPSRIENYLPELPSMDQLVRLYNMYWGAVSDTHMTEFKGSYLITGSRVNRREIFKTLLTADHWEDLRFPHSFCYIMMQKNLCGTFTLVNGQTAYVICPWDGEGPNPVFIDDTKSAKCPPVAKRFMYGCCDDL